MGHARVDNLSRFFVRRLYARGTLSIAEAVAGAIKAGEVVHASEADYDEPDMLAQVFEQIVDYLTMIDPSAHGYTGPCGGGPWIQPVLTAWHGKRKAVTGLTRRMLDAVEKGDHDPLTMWGVVDRLIEEGFPEWAGRVKALPRQRELYGQWRAGEIPTVAREWQLKDLNSEISLFDAIPFRFYKGWRRRYKEVPLLQNIEN